MSSSPLVMRKGMRFAPRLTRDTKLTSVVVSSVAFISSRAIEDPLDERKAVNVAHGGFRYGAACDAMNVTVRGRVRHAAEEVALLVELDDEARGVGLDLVG